MIESARNYTVTSAGRIGFPRPIQERWGLEPGVGTLQVANLRQGALILPSHSALQLVEALCPESDLFARATLKMKRFIRGSEPLRQTPPTGFDLFTHQHLSQPSILQLPSNVVKSLNERQILLWDYNSGVVLTTQGSTLDISALVPTELLQEGSWLRDRQGRLAPFFGDAYSDWIEQRGTVVYERATNPSTKLRPITSDTTQLATRIREIVTRDALRIATRKSEEQAQD